MPKFIVVSGTTINANEIVQIDDRGTGAFIYLSDGRRLTTTETKAAIITLATTTS